MARYVMMVLTNATEGNDEEFNDWYTNQHLPDVLNLRGFTAAHRYELVAGPSLPAPSHKYLALYEVETDDLAAAHASVAAAANTPAMPLSESFDRTNVVVGYFRPVATLRR